MALRSKSKLRALLLAVAAATSLSACGGDAAPPAISIVTFDVVPDPLFEDDPSFSFRIFFEGDVVPEAGGISVLVEDELGQVYRRLDRVVRPEPDGTLVSVEVPMLYDLGDPENPILPVPGPIAIRIFDGASFETSTLRDEAFVTLTARGVVESGALAGGGPLARGAPTIIWGVTPRIDPMDPGLVYQGNVDIWSLEGAEAGDSLLVEYGDFNGARDTQFASVYLRNPVTGDFVAQRTERSAGTPTTLVVPAGGDYHLYVVHDPTQWADVAEYRITWR